jgi:hypothetical protein
VPRPKYIADVHDAHYELRLCAKEGVEKAEKAAKYQAALTRAARISGNTEHDLEDAVRHDFHVWMKQEGLPKPSRK